MYRQCATPVFLLASRKLDAYPEVGSGLTLGPDASPDLLVQSLEPATRLLVAVVNDADPEVRAVIFRRPEIIVAASLDFVPQGAMELSLHAHDMCTGLKVAFEPPAELCYRLREDTRHGPCGPSLGTAFAVPRIRGATNSRVRAGSVRSKVDSARARFVLASEGSVLRRRGLHRFGLSLGGTAPRSGCREAIASGE